MVTVGVRRNGDSAPEWGFRRYGGGWGAPEWGFRAGMGIPALRWGMGCAGMGILRRNGDSGATVGWGMGCIV
ncbi:MAG: hypothetical protein Kow0063_30530 [Anaerolineae bacterium]